MAQWQQLDIAGKLADVYFPGRRAPANFAVLFLHGHALVTLKDNEVYTAQLERLGWACLCPHGKRSWWGNRICAEFDARMTPVEYLRQAVLPWMESQFGSAPPAIALLGVGMGGQGALKLAYQYPQHFPVVAALAPAVDFHTWHGRGLPLDEMYSTAEAARQDTATLLLHPLNWPRHQLLMCDPSDADWFDGTERLASKLYSTGIPFERDFETRHGGHSWDYFNHVAPRVMEFIASSLEQESRRLPMVPPEARVSGNPDPRRPG